MANVLITYDLCQPGRDYKALEDAIQALGKARRILESVWVVKTGIQPSEIQQLLCAHLDANDKLFVTQFGLWASYHLDRDLFQWLLSR